jgi:hypothetical protein
MLMTHFLQDLHRVAAERSFNFFTGRAASGRLLSIAPQYRRATPQDTSIGKENAWTHGLQLSVFES